jgi:hypothetical protein
MTPMNHPVPPRTTRRRPTVRSLLAAACLLSLGGCAVQPWVKPYERERLADPVMTGSRGLLADRHTGHVRAVREGARGATGVQGGGCGCN